MSQITFSKWTESVASQRIDRICITEMQCPNALPRRKVALSDHIHMYNDLVAAYKEAFPDMSHQQVVLFWQNCNFVHLRVCFCDTFLKIFYFFLNIACFYFYFCIIIFCNHFTAVVAFFDDFIFSLWILESGAQTLIIDFYCKTCKNVYFFTTCFFLCLQTFCLHCYISCRVNIVNVLQKKSVSKLQFFF